MARDPEVPHRLRDLTAALESDWGITVGGPVAGGTSSYVSSATTADGTAAVLKLVMPTDVNAPDAFINEIRTLLAADGRGCVRVLTHDAARGAVLLERLGRQLVEVGLPVRAQLRAICTVFAELWAVPPDPRLPSGAEKGR